MSSTTMQTISEIVAGDYRAAAIFQRHGLDFCCGGGRSVEDACRSRDVDMERLLAELAGLATLPADGASSFNEYPLDRLADHIVERHHRYVREALPVALGHIRKVARVHGERHPETVEIAAHFERIAAGLVGHLEKEEGEIFPCIGALVAAELAGGMPDAAPFGALRDLVGTMEAEHEEAGAGMAAIRRLSADYTPPDDACMTYRVCYNELREFEEDLHLHVHLENNILFPKALALEAALQGAAMPDSAP